MDNCFATAFAPSPSNSEWTCASSPHVHVSRISSCIATVSVTLLRAVRASCSALSSAPSLPLSDITSAMKVVTREFIALLPNSVECTSPAHRRRNCRSDAAPRTCKGSYWLQIWLNRSSGVTNFPITRRYACASSTDSSWSYSDSTTSSVSFSGVAALRTSTWSAWKWQNASSLGKSKKRLSKNTRSTYSYSHTLTILYSSLLFSSTARSIYGRTRVLSNSRSVRS
mmetsp:Transcript_12049/g.33957  ORF Transcript_12049/g.33957 Transcript_12049/m.33957 type:complete len:226 (+) Transcript_12049:2338-3015(+)